MNPPETDGPLQFDQAEYSGPVAASAECKVCHSPILDHYYDVNGNMVCSKCRAQLDRKPTGSEKFWKLIQAGFRGSCAAFGGFLLYYVVMKVTGYEIGLISIVVGVMVGTAVHAGSGKRGGWVYQLLAVFLTYSAISASYAMMVIPQMLEEPVAANPAPAEKAAAPAPAKAPDDFVALVAAVAIWTGFLMIFAYAVPIISGFQSPIGLLIVGFALWEAWKLNKRVVPVIQGPFALLAPPAASDIEVIPEDEADDDA